MSELKSRILGLISSVISFVKRRKILSIIIAIVVIIAIFGVVKLSSNGTVETTSPITADLVRTVKIAGKVTPRESVELGFETSGTVTSISKDVGDTVRRGETIARLDSSNTYNDVLQAQAELTLAEAELKKLEGAGTIEAQIDNSKRSLIQTIVDTYTASDDAVHNKTDEIFVDPQAVRPEIVYAFSSNFELRDGITKSRALMDEKLKSWKSLVNSTTVADYSDENLLQSKKYLSDISSYINSVAQAVNLFKPSTSLSQSTIDTYKADALAARNSLNTVSQDLITAEDKYRGLLSDVPVQVARVESAKAQLSNHKTMLAKTYLASPINGVVSRNDAKPGQVVSSANSLVSVISPELEIEAFIPEILISGVQVGNSSSVTLDAYSDTEIFEAKVAHIDPAETIRDGVSTYKVRLTFDTPDQRIRPGMTSNVEIETFRKPQVVLIPERAVVKEDNKTFVDILTSGGEKERVGVEIGERDSSGQVELLSELPSGSKVIISPISAE